jgi:hypothetical protein
MKIFKTNKYYKVKFYFNNNFDNGSYVRLNCSRIMVDSVFKIKQVVLKITLIYFKKVIIRSVLKA